MKRPRLVVALDVADADAARGWARTLSGIVDVLKVGLELFVAEGPELARELGRSGYELFLDLKLHDIPATVAGAVRAARSVGADLLTLHAAGGEAMLRAAAAARGTGCRPRLLAVTVLTSLSARDLQGQGCSDAPADLAARFAVQAKECGCDGVVASVHETAALRSRCGDDFLIVTPGIRPAGFAQDDQARVATPAEAVRAGADYLVVGRPIIRANDPRAVARAIRREMDRA